MALAIWRARNSDSSPREQAEAVQEVVEAVGGRLEAVYWTATAGELLAVVDFAAATDDNAAVLGPRVLVQSGEFAVCEAIELQSVDDASVLYEQAEALLEDEDEPDEAAEDSDD